MQLSQHNGPSQGGSDVSSDSMSSGIKVRDNLLLPRSSLPKDDAQTLTASYADNYRIWTGGRDGFWNTSYTTMQGSHIMILPGTGSFVKGCCPGNVINSA